MFNVKVFCKTSGLCVLEASLPSIASSKYQHLITHKETQTCAYSSEGLYDHPLVVIGACGRLKNVEENLLEEHLQTEST